MDVFHFAEFGNLKYVHHTIDTFSGFQWATALISEKADSVITHLLEVMAVMGIPAQIKTDNSQAYVSTKLEQFFKYFNIKHVPAYHTILQEKQWLRDSIEHLRRCSTNKLGRLNPPNIGCIMLY